MKGLVPLLAAAALSGCAAYPYPADYSGSGYAYGPYYGPYYGSYYCGPFYGYCGDPFLYGSANVFIEPRFGFHRGFHHGFHRGFHGGFAGRTHEHVAGISPGGHHSDRR
jgi:hypothetical protein